MPAEFLLPLEQAIKRLPHVVPDARPDIFDTLDHWLESPELAYASWLSRQRLRDSTKAVYTAMFNRFCAWLSQRNRRLDQLGAGDIGLFLDTANPNMSPRRRHAQTTRQRQQYVRQLERVYQHLAALGYEGSNAGREAGIERLGQGQDKPARFLDPEERQVVIEVLDRQLAALQNDADGKADWMAYRDLAIVAVMLGAGLKVGQVRALTLKCIDLPERHIELSRPGCAHRARIQPFAMAPLEAWLSVQDALHGHVRDPKRLVFEADRQRGFGRQSKTPMLAASSIHRRTQRLLAEAGITGDRACAQTLRNTYSGLLIDGGATDEHLVDCLGLQVVVTGQRLRAAYAKVRNTSVRLISAGVASVTL